MQAVVSVAEMQAIDADAPEPVEVLIDRAGAAVARAAIELLGGAYGRRVVLIHGPGNNGADGRVAGARLRRRGVRVDEFALGQLPPTLPRADLVIDAALGTGISRPFDAPDPDGAPVLAVDIPSGVHGDSGAVLGSAMAATRTVTFAAPTPGLLLGDGRHLAGDVVVADIGLDTSRASIGLVDDADVAALVPARAADAHKWRRSVLVVAGSPGMTGAASLTSEAALRAGAGMVRLATPGVHHGADVPREVVSERVDADNFAGDLLDRPGKADAIAIGPGLGTALATRHQIRRIVSELDRPMVIDGDGITALGADAAAVLAGRSAPAVLTPHDGEFDRLRPPDGEDRIATTRGLARAIGAVVLRKGPTTIVAAPDGTVRLVTAGDDRLATAGTGDVLTGIIASLLAAGLDGRDAAAIGAHVHGRAGSRIARHGAVASDVIAALPDVRSELERVR